MHIETLYCSCSSKTCYTSMNHSMLFRSLRNDETSLKRRRVCLLRCLIYFYAHMEAPDLSLQSVETSKLKFMFKICHQP